jgi:hypothetical protein
MVNKDIKIYLSLIILIALIIAGIFLIKNMINSTSNIIDEDTIKCISSKSFLYSQVGCSHCITQKEILGNSTKLFNIIECNEGDNLKKCNNVGITATPTWIIDNKKYPGVKSLEELKQLTSC